MNIHDHRKLGEALEYLDGHQEWLHSVPDAVAGALWVSAGAARQTYDRWQECEHCVGSGCSFGNHETTHIDLQEMCKQWPCPSCGGTGLQPNQARLEAAAKAEHESRLHRYSMGTNAEWNDALTVGQADALRSAESVVRAFNKEAE